MIIVLLLSGVEMSQFKDLVSTSEVTESLITESHTSKLNGTCEESFLFSLKATPRNSPGGPSHTAHKLSNHSQQLIENPAEHSLHTNQQGRSFRQIRSYSRVIN